MFSHKYAALMLTCASVISDANIHTSVQANHDGDQMSTLQIQRSSNGNCPHTKHATDAWSSCLKRLPVSKFVKKHGSAWIKLVRKMKQEPADPYFKDMTVSPRFQHLSWYDLLATIHGTNYPENSFAHMGVHFGTWHRLLMWLFDKGMNEVSDTPEQAILAPYWDWTQPRETAELYKWLGGDGNQFDHQCVSGPFAWPSYNITVNNEHYLDGVKQWQCVARAISQEGTVEMDLEMASHLPSFGDVQNAIVDQRYDNQPYDVSSMGAMSFRNNLEGYGAWDNEGTNLVKAGHQIHGFHNIVHLDVGNTMATLISPNDPMFWTHHGNIDRMLQTWLDQSGELYGTGYPKKVDNYTNLTHGYPAQIYKVDPACHNMKIIMSVDTLPGMGVMFKFGDGKEEDWKKFLMCSYAKDPSGNQVIGHGSYGKRILLGFQKGDAHAAHIPSMEELYTDPLAFEANMPDGKLVYESFVLGVQPTLNSTTQLKTNFISAIPNHFEKALAFGLLRPHWFKENTNGELVKRTLEIPFNVDGNLTEFDAMEFSAIASTHNGWMKMDLEDYSPDHYWMPGYIKAVINRPLTLTYDGTWLEPLQSCYNNLTGMEAFGCKTNGTSSPPKDQYPVGHGVFGGHASQSKYSDPWSTSTAIVQLTDHQCLTLDELKAKGYVSSNGDDLAYAEAMMPVDKKFCVVSGYFLGHGGIALDEQKKSWETFFGTPGKHINISSLPNRNMNKAEMLPFKPASLSIAPYPEPRQHFWNEGKVDVTEHIHVGARPGGNAQDTLKPFDQLGFQISPADLFTPSTARYDSEYEVIR